MRPHDAGPGPKCPGHARGVPRPGNQRSTPRRVSCRHAPTSLAPPADCRGASAPALHRHRGASARRYSVVGAFWRRRHIVLALLGALAGSGQIAAPASPALDLAQWEPEIRAFEEADRQSTPATGGIVFAGSSSIRLWKTMADDFAGLPVLNRGFGGSQIREVTAFADRIVIPYRPRLIVFYCGSNDVVSGRAVPDVVGDLQAFVAKVHAAVAADSPDLHLDRAQPGALAPEECVARSERADQGLHEDRCAADVRRHLGRDARAPPASRARSCSWRTSCT